MNKYILSHKTGLQALREYRIDVSNMQTLTFLDSILKERNNPFKQKIDLLVQNKNNTRKNNKYNFHVSTSKINNKSLIMLRNNIYCVSPELLIIQLASKLTFESLFLLVCELCGTYSLDVKNNTFVPGQIPATTINKVNKYKDTLLKSQKYFRGKTILNKVLLIAKDRSFSPMESKLLLKLSGPRNMGMYGIKNIELNSPVKLSKEASLIAGQNIVVPDLSIPLYKVAIEYDSSQFHENITQGQKDKRRRDALVQDGWIVHAIVPSIMNNPNSFHVVAMAILSETKQNTRIRNKNFIYKRNNVFKTLL